MTTNEYIIEMSVGPVQGFIDSARRTRDLWRGSQLLSQISMKLANELRIQGVALTYPTQVSLDAIEKGSSNANISNIILGNVAADSEDQVRQILENAKTNTRAYLSTLASQATETYHALLRTDIDVKSAANAMEFYSAWVQLGSDYKTSYNSLKSILGARKATKNFLQLNEPAGLPKSSLDGIHNTVFNSKVGKVGVGKAKKLRLSKNEQLDLLGLIKRGTGDAEHFTPFSRLACHTWVESLPPESLELLCQAYEPLLELDIATRVKGNRSVYQRFPYDGQLLFPFRLEVFLGECKEGKQDEDSIAYDALQNLKRVLLPLWKSHGEPVPYAVLLMADGDRMGELIDKAKTAEQHAQISDALFTFSTGVDSIVRSFNGHAIYAGGDDVMGLLPLNEAIECAKSLAENFQSHLETVAQKLGVEKKQAPTLSVGIAICHFMEPLGTIRNAAKKAQDVAKGNIGNVSKSESRNALGISLSIRSGHQKDIRIRWDQPKAHEVFRKFVTAFENGYLTSRLAYDARAIDLKTRGLFADSATESSLEITLPTLSRLEWIRAISRSLENNPDTKRYTSEDECKKLPDVLKVRAAEVGLETLAKELLIARWLAARSAKELAGALE